ncbi:glycogen/starch synthase [Flavobacteriaceae bacterium]|jgi:starch synthase|nr:glycogen/starch synthase [Flavobacteriaceae bacterium]MDA8850814.1 glycogen/starch synthase [Flavobacteriaceae bacterium]MDA9250788.1 glycogen/starch synthase [Flavobacteriaceae bacterium]
MKEKRVLNISSEVVPYLPQTNQAVNSFQIPKNINDHGGQTRIFMPRYGLINERRHQLHEVIRLSGMNLVVNDVDMPLIIKVASIPKERMQVYFIDNEEYFKRRAVLRDEKDVLFADNDERMIFFTKGVIETVKKLNWSPDVIHLHGWFTSLFPLYLKTYYKDEPIFADCKIVTSVYAKDFEGVFSKDFQKKVAFDEIPDKEIILLKNANFENLTQLSLNYSDGYVIADAETPEEIEKSSAAEKIPGLSFEETQQKDALINFYSQNII